MKKWNQPNYFTVRRAALPHTTSVAAIEGELRRVAAAGYLPFGLGDAVVRSTGTNKFAAGYWLSTLLGGALGVHMR